MKFEHISKIADGRQDGAIFGDYLFSFNHKGECTVYKMEDVLIGNSEPFSEFSLDKTLIPHSNSVTFGNDFYYENDEFPCLYTNIYNNYANEEEKLPGTTLVYRIMRNGNKFTTKLVQIIKVGFCEDELWSSKSGDIRPYGNSVIDKENGIYYAFTMRDEEMITRYFAFDLPEVTAGEIDEKYNVKKVVLEKSNIKYYFDCPYHHFIQGGILNDGKIYSLEGFTGSVENPPAMRIIDTKLKEEISYIKFEEYGLKVEPEMIDFYKNECIYGDHNGNIYKINLQE